MRSVLCALVGKWWSMVLQNFWINLSNSGFLRMEKLNPVKSIAEVIVASGAGSRIRHKYSMV